MNAPFRLFWHPLSGFLAAAVCAAVSFADPAADPMAAQDRRLFADGLQSRRLFDRAAAEYEALLRDYPAIDDRDVLLFRWGESLREIHRTKEADGVFAKLLDEFPSSAYAPRAHFNRGAIALADGDFGSAAGHLRRALDAKPDPKVREDALYFLAEALWRAERVDDATPAFESFLSEFPQSQYAGYARIALASCLERRTGEAGADSPDAARARALLRETAGSTDETLAAEALHLLGEFDFRRGAYQESADAFAELRRRFPESRHAAESAIRSAWASDRSNRPAETLALAEAALRDSAVPNRDEWMFLKGRALFELNRFKEGTRAMEDLVNTFESSPYLVSAAYAYALGCSRLGRHADAVAMASLIPRDDPLRPRILRLCGLSHEALGHGDQAIGCYEELVQSFPDDADAEDSHYRLARLRQAAGHWTEAAEAYAGFAAKYPASTLHARALYARAACLKSDNRPAEAVAVWDELVRVHPDDELAADALYLAGMESFHGGRHDEALAKFGAYLALGARADAHRAEALFWRASLLVRAERFAEALEALNAAVAASPPASIAGEIRYQKWFVLQRLERLDEAADDLEGLLDLPDCAKRLQPAQTAWAIEHQYRRGRLDAARRIARFLADTAEADDWRQTAWGWLGRVEAARGDAASAEAAFRNAVSIPAETRYAAEAQLRIGEYRLAARDATSAERHFQDALARSQSGDMVDVRVRATVGLAHAWLALGRREDAVRQLLGVCMISRDETLIPPLIAETVPLLRELGRDAEAEVLLQDLREVYPESQAARDLLPPEEAPRP